MAARRSTLPALIEKVRDGRDLVACRPAPEQTADILCGNAARFLRLDPTVCEP